MARLNQSGPILCRGYILPMRSHPVSLEAKLSPRYLRNRLCKRRSFRVIPNTLITPCSTRGSGGHNLL
ncbi:uncharacterized protein PHACADRAFT_253259 [Phanerochaete carnosa HHB-10118-sp]|uniref:Uncharacterized protein n=1 Tax=Phanerochaete carnosa (strain HHB-10118-sp) TaxID=650164 RepID=K5X0F1_PHACS|nr:uncharacterized protein PHACADRAFT_253259 [Phanerochaete carnosa HHB-10118-sp]EKM56242.1 hypothetical protein PHACADRAFT_253259 [Phanerochaete carnosa HHB-10118-sp]